jgi:hypothetical protein
MRIIDLIKENLLGKKILVYEFDFKLDKKTPIQKRYYLDKEVGLAWSKRDTRNTYVGEVYKTIIDVTGDSDNYEGDSVYIYVDGEPMNQLVNVTILDEIIIKE